MVAPAWVAPILALIVSFVLPKLISYVARSSKRWVNWAIAIGSSVVVGVLSALVAGDFTRDVWASLTVAITATQGAYNAYWKDRLSPQS